MHYYIDFDNKKLPHKMKFFYVKIVRMDKSFSELLTQMLLFSYANK